MSSFRFVALRDRLRESLWTVPGLGLLIAILLSEVIPRIGADDDGQLMGVLVAGVSAASARVMLSAIAAATITLAGLVFSVTMLLLQLATSQLSPRVMRTFLADRGNQVVLALFVGTFAYALLAIRGIEVTSEASIVPSLTLWVGFVLALLSVGGFIYYTDHVAHTIRPVNVIARVVDDTRGAIDRLYPEPFGEPAREPPLPGGPPDHVVRSPLGGGVVVAVDTLQLEELAVRHECVVELTAMIGDYVANGAGLFRVWGALPPEVLAELPATVVVSRERTMRQDPAFGLRQLVDVAERALSPGVNDPTTAVQVIDGVHDVLRRLVDREIPPRHRADEAGRLRLILPRPDWDDYVALAVDEIRLYGQRSLQVTRRLRYLLDDLEDVAPPARREVLARQQSLLQEGARVGFELEHDRALATRAGRQGHGP